MNVVLACDLLRSHNVIQGQGPGGVVSCSWNNRKIAKNTLLLIRSSIKLLDNELKKLFGMGEGGGGGRVECGQSNH